MARDIRARAFYRANALGLPLDKTGAFLTRRVMPQPFPPEIVFGLKVWPRDAEYPGVTDSLIETRLTIFPPWDFFYPNR